MARGIGTPLGTCSHTQATPQKQSRAQGPLTLKTHGSKSVTEKSPCGGGPGGMRHAEQLPGQKGLVMGWGLRVCVPSLPIPRALCSPPQPHPPTPAASATVPLCPQDQGDDDQKGAEDKAKHHGQVPSLESRWRGQRGACGDSERRGLPCVAVCLGYCDLGSGPPEPLREGKAPRGEMGLEFLPQR